MLRLTEHHELELEPIVREADLARRADRAALPAGLPGPVPGLRPRARSGPHDHPDVDIDPRLEALRAFRVADAG